MPDDYFTTDELRDRYPEISLAAYPDVRVEEVRALAEEAIEHETGYAFVPRTATDVVHGQSVTGARALTRSPVRSITSATDQDAGAIDITGARVDGRWITLPAGWPVGPTQITYSYGYDQPPARVKQAAMVLTREWLISGPVTDRQTQLPTEGGGAVNLSVPGGRFGTFGIPEVDATVESYGRKSLIG